MFYSFNVNCCNFTLLQFKISQYLIIEVLFFSSLKILKIIFLHIIFNKIFCSFNNIIIVVSLYHSLKIFQYLIIVF